MGVANLPATKDKSSTEVEIPKEWETAINLLLDGRTPSQVGRKLYPEDKKAARQFSWRLRHLMRTKPEFRQVLFSMTQAELGLQIPMMAPALAKRASRGRPDAIKLAWEATGFHAPRVQHEHSGDVAITVKVPRPEGRELPEKVVDAEVVEESNEA